MWLVDTNVICELVKPSPNEGVLRWAASIQEAHLSVVTLEEIRFGLAWKPNPGIQQLLETLFQDRFRFLPITECIARAAGEIRGSHQSQVSTLTQADMFIAATASQHALTLVTRNVKDFRGCHISLLNPFNEVDSRGPS